MSTRTELEISVRAATYTQYLRQPPILHTRQRLPLDMRGGLSFDCVGFDDASSERA